MATLERRDARIRQLKWIANKVEDVIRVRAREFGDSGLCERDAKDQRKFDAGIVREYRYLLRQIADEEAQRPFAYEAEAAFEWE